MRVGLGLLRLSPADFWAMTPREFERAAAPLMAVPSDAPNAVDLARLMRRFPDGDHNPWPRM